MGSNLVPQLRFPEFSREWNSEEFGLFATFSKGKGISKSDIDKDGVTECIRYGELYTEYSEIITKIASKTNIDKKELVLSEVNDVIIPASGETQTDIATASCVTKSGVALSGDLNIIKSEVDGVFLSYYLNSARKFDIARLAQGISVVHLYASQLSKLYLSIPILLEQTKVATFLTAIDKRISLLKEKKKLIEQYKKGLMQKIFSQEIRFKDENGNDFPEWEEKRADEVFFSHSNKKHNGDLPILSASQKNGMIFRNESGIEIQASKKSIKSYKIVEPGDFVITLRSFQGGLDYSNKLGICSPAYTILKESIPVEKIFYKFYFKKDSFIERLSKTVVGIRDGKQITYSAFGGLKIPYPSKHEQAKISSCLISIEKAIDKLQLKIDNSELYKKGLLQKMFV